MTAQNTAGTTLTCTNDDCPCQLEIVTPCPHGDRYVCACGHPFEAVEGGRGSGIGARAEEAGIVDQQAVVLDEIEGTS